LKSAAVPSVEPKTVSQRAQPQSLKRRYAVLAAALGLLSLAYLALGVYTLVFDVSFSTPVDLRLRWIEEGMVDQGENPQEHAYPEDLFPELLIGGRNVKGNYPPWAYATGMALAPPLGWSAARIYFAGVCLVAFAGLGYWAFSAGRRAGRQWGWFTAAAALSAFAICVAISYGQYSLIVTALIVASLACLEHGRMAPAGLALALAAVKPQLAALFFLVPAIFEFRGHERIRFFLSAATYLAAASIGIAIAVHSTPWEMLKGPASESIKFYHLSNNPLIIWAVNWFGFSMGSNLLALGMAAACILLLVTVRSSGSLLAGFSVCAITSLFWSYSRHYDVLLLTIPLVELFLLWQTRQSRLACAAFFALGLLLWSPITMGLWRLPVSQFGFGGVCLFALVTIISLESKTSGVPAAAGLSIRPSLI
jgi:hypothetical protein